MTDKNTSTKRDRLNTVDVGLLVLRMGLGVTCILHALPRLAAGRESWSHIGQAMGVMGITVAPQLWGTIAVMSGLLGGIGLIIGLGVRVASFFLAATTYAATVVLFSLGENFPEASQTMELMIVFVALTILGSGRLGLAHRLGWRVLK